MSESKTPRTDAAWDALERRACGLYCVKVKMEELETELATLTAELAEMKSSHDDGGATVPCIPLLAARDAAIEKVVKDCGGDDAPENERLRVAFVMVAREAAGRGFDEGVRFIAANAAGQGREAYPAPACSALNGGQHG